MGRALSQLQVCKQNTGENVDSQQKLKSLVNYGTETQENISPTKKNTYKDETDSWVALMIISEIPKHKMT